MDLGLLGAWRLPARLYRGLLACAGVWAVLWGPPVTAAAVVTTADARAVAASPTLRKIRARGEVAVGVRTDFPPFGWIDAKGRHRGLEADLAQELAEHLRVRLRLVPVTGEDRFTRLGQGAVDVLIASAADTPARRAHAAAVEPPYYGSGVDVLLRPERHETRWLHLRGSTLCAVADAPFNPQMTQRHHVQLHASASLGEALQALQARRCEGLLYTEATVQHLRRLPEWSDYRAPLAPALVMPWAVSIARGEQGTALEREIGDAVAAWHRDGTLIDLERKWGLKPSVFLRKARARWSELGADGARVCVRDARGHWPAACGAQALVEPVTASAAGRAASGIRPSGSAGLAVLFAAALAASGGWGARAWRTRHASSQVRAAPVLRLAGAAEADPGPQRQRQVPSVPAVRIEVPACPSPAGPPRRTIPMMRTARSRGARPIRPRRRSLRRPPIRP